LLGIGEKEDIVDDCVPFTGEGICPTCKHKHITKPKPDTWNYGAYKPKSEPDWDNYGAYKPKSEPEWDTDFHSIWATTYPPAAANK